MYSLYTDGYLLTEEPYFSRRQCILEFIDLKKQYSRLEDEINANIKAVLAHGHYIGGPEIAQLEKELCAYTGSRYCVTCANGTDALQLALMALGVGPGDAVFVPSFTFMSTAEVVALVGATPVFTDIDLSTFNMLPESLETAVTKTIKEGKLRPKAVIPVDLFGQCADYPEILPIANKYSLHVIEDGAQGFGGAIGAKRACSFGNISATSFFPAKPLGCYGDGGAVFTDDEVLHNRLVSTHVHGKGTMKYDNIRIGLNSRLDTIQAAVLLPKLHAFIEDELDLRNRWAMLYTELLKDRVRTPSVRAEYTSSWAQYTIMFENSAERDKAQAKLREAGIPAMIYYYKPLHRQTVYLPLGYEEGSLPNSEIASQCVLSLPMHPYLDEQAVREVANVILANV